VGSPRLGAASHERAPGSAAAPTLGRRQGQGLVFGVLCALNGAFVPSVARFTTLAGDATWVAAVTTGFAGLAAACVLFFRGELGRLFSGGVTRELVLLGALGTVVPFLLFFAGTARTSAIEAVLCLQIEPFYSLLLSWWALGHRLTLRRASAALVLLLGLVVAVGGGAGRSGDLVGLLLLLATPLCWQLSHLLVLRRLTGVPPQILTGARYVFGALLLLPLAWTAAPGDAAPAVTAGRLAVLAFQGVVLCYVGTMLWYLAIARIDLARATAIVVPSIPVLSLGVSFALLGEIPSLRQLVGVALTVAGVVTFALAPHAVPARERIPVPAAPIALPVEPEQGDDAA
jgi:drug/metabolite transporter (DMT)-like permease